MNLINFKRLYEKRPRGRSSTHRDIKYRGFPAPITIGGSIYWDEELVDRWLQQQAEVPYTPKPVAVPKEGKRRGRKPKNTGEVFDEK